ncbi:unnamed protein product [Notodromas monacha]|uniref:Uncharacterized protein n=1 Tax=Notodromas monacha TaxID=399045 RepID=A0A7R9BHD2_9CRUS|nr:unnamed protein product [Notodromas monacha]CAG0915493.1 unnamed protein product [Notodromas monacha]
MDQNQSPTFGKHENPWWSGYLKPIASGVSWTSNGTYELIHQQFIPCIDSQLRDSTALQIGDVHLRVHETQYRSWHQPILSPGCSEKRDSAPTTSSGMKKNLYNSAKIQFVLIEAAAYIYVRPT